MPDFNKAGHTQRQWEGKFFRCGMECYYCRVPLTLQVATKDHLTPLSRGGADLISNIVPACFDCNRIKGDQTAQEFFAARAAFSTKQQEFTCVPLSNPNHRSLEDSLLLKQLQRERANVGWWKA